LLTEKKRGGGWEAGTVSPDPGVEGTQWGKVQKKPVPVPDGFVHRS